MWEILIDELAVPMTPAISSACEMLGLDPLYMANEGNLAVIVPEAEADAVLERMQKRTFGVRAAAIGRVIDRHPSVVASRTGIGGMRIVPLPVGEQLPRIC